MKICTEEQTFPVRQARAGMQALLEAVGRAPDELHQFNCSSPAANPTLMASEPSYHIISQHDRHFSAAAEDGTQSLPASQERLW